MKGVRLALLALLVAGSRAAAQCPPGPEPGWCERTEAGPDGALGTADDRPDCVSARATSCADHEFRPLTFNDAAPCTDCARTYYVQVAAGAGFWLYFEPTDLLGAPAPGPATSLRVRAVAVATGADLVLSAENECAEREGLPPRSDWNPGPMVYCDDCAGSGRLMAHEDWVTLSPTEAKPELTCDVVDTGIGALLRTAPAVPCLSWRASGTEVAWGPPLDPDGDGDLDEDDDGVVDALSAPPCTPCVAPACPCGATSDENAALGSQHVRVFVPVPRAEPRVARIEIFGGGGGWTLVAACDRPEFAPAFGWLGELLLHDTCAAAVAAHDAAPALPLLSFPAPPVPGVEVIDTSSCPDRVTLRLTACNAGAVPASSVPVAVLRNLPDPLPLADVDMTAHPTDPACQGPLLPGECRTCTFEVDVAGAETVQVAVDWRHAVLEADEAAPPVGCAPGPDVLVATACVSACVPVTGGSIVPASACLGQTVTIDAFASRIGGCASTEEYLLESPLGTPVPPGTWTTLPRWAIAPDVGSHDYWVRFRCPALPGCEGLTGPLHADVDPPPAFASALLATPEGDCGIRLSWSPAAGSVTYDVHRADASPVPLDAAHRIAAGLAATEYLDVVGSAGPFFYRVVSQAPGCVPVPNGGGEAGASPSLVGMPGAIAAVAEGECALRVSWDPAVTSASVTYDLYRAGSSPVPLDAAHLVASGLTVTTLLDPVPWGAPVSYRVEAANACHRVANALGDSAPASVADLTPPSFAGIVDTRDLGECRVEVTWGAASDACSGIAGFNVYRDHGVAHAGETLVAALVPGSPHVDATPGNGTWVYVVRAVDAAGREESNGIFRQESEGSCSNDFPRDAGLDREDGIDSPNGDHGRLRRGALGDGLRIRWKPSPDEGGLYPVTYAVHRGDLRSLRAGEYPHALVAPDACDLQAHEYVATGQDDGVPAYYLIVSVSGDNVTAGYDSFGARIPAREACP